MKEGGLAYVALAVRDVQAAAHVLEHRFELGRREAQTPEGHAVPLFAVGASALAVFACDDPFLGEGAAPGLHHLAITAANPEQKAQAAGIAGSETLASQGLDGAREVRLDSAPSAGVRLRITEPLQAAPRGGDLMQRIDHVGVASADNAAATEFFASRLGLEVESTQTDLEVHTATESFTSDRYGIVYHNRAPRIVGGLRVTFITIGDCELEFLQPLDASGLGVPGDERASGPGTTRGDKTAIGRYMEKHGGGLHHLALKTADIDATLASLSQQGLSVIDAQGRPGSRRARIGFIHPRSLSGVLVHLVERDDN